MTKEFSGGCLCGAVKYVCAAEPVMSGHCHCEDCRRSSGTGHGSHLAVPRASLSITGETKGYARSANSGNVVTRNFCPNCGSGVFSTNPAMPDLVFVRASSLDDLEVFKPQMHVFSARAASWDKPTEGVPSFEIMPPR